MFKKLVNWIKNTHAFVFFMICAAYVLLSDLVFSPVVDWYLKSKYYNHYITLIMIIFYALIAIISVISMCIFINKIFNAYQIYKQDKEVNKIGEE